MANRPKDDKGNPKPNRPSAKGHAAKQNFNEDDFDYEDHEFNPEESIYELEPFVLPGESITQQDVPIIRREDSLYENEKRHKEIKQLESTIPPGQQYEQSSELKKLAAQNYNGGTPLQNEYTYAPDATISPEQAVDALKFDQLQSQQPQPKFQADATISPEQAVDAIREFNNAPGQAALPPPQPEFRADATISPEQAIDAVGTFNQAAHAPSPQPFVQKPGQPLEWESDKYDDEPTIQHPEYHHLTPEERQMLFAFEQRKRKFNVQSSNDPMVGKLLANKYGILELIGRGAMSTVYKVESFSDGQVYAAKMCKYGANKEERARFEREMETHAKLSHPAIVQFIETVEWSGRKFIVMENIKGISLLDVIEIHGPISQAENIWHIMIQICDALEHAHKRGVIHRDLKAGNVILAKKEDEEMQVKVLDFGIARVDTEDSQRLTRDGEAVGSPHYMSPEQCQALELDSSSDIYSLGVLGYELVTGKFPYSGRSIIEVMKCHVDPSIKPRSIRDLANQVPKIELLERILFKALESEKVLRFETAQDFKKALNYWIEQVRATEPGN